jgi:hypothetical protein
VLKSQPAAAPVWRAERYQSLVVIAITNHLHTHSDNPDHIFRAVVVNRVLELLFDIRSRRTRNYLLTTAVPRSVVIALRYIADSTAAESRLHSGNTRLFTLTNCTLSLSSTASHILPAPLLSATVRSYWDPSCLYPPFRRHTLLTSSL